MTLEELEKRVEALEEYRLFLINRTDDIASQHAIRHMGGPDTLLYGADGSALKVARSDHDHTTDSTVSHGDLTGKDAFSEHNAAYIDHSGASVTMSSNSFALTAGIAFYTVSPEGGSPGTDQLDTITGGTTGQEIELVFNKLDTITIAAAAGGGDDFVQLPGGGSTYIVGTSGILSIQLVKTAGGWYPIGGSGFYGHAHAAAASGGQLDHGATLTGLTDDDHTQYVLRNILTTRGDVFRRGASAIERVALGSAGAVFNSDGTDPGWTVATRTIVLSAAGGAPTTTAGCAALAQVEAATNDVDYWALDFDQSTQEHAFWGPIVLPDNYDGSSNINVTFYWTAASGTGNVIWGIQMITYGDSDAIETAWPAASTVTDGLITAGDVHISSAVAHAPGGDDTGGELCAIRVHRKAADASDTLTADARLIAVHIEYSTNAYSD